MPGRKKKDFGEVLKMNGREIENELGQIIAKHQRKDDEKDIKQPLLTLADEGIELDCRKAVH